MDQNLIGDATWALVAPFLPPERGRACRPAIDNRQVLDAIFWIARTGAPWRDLPERFGKWNTGRALDPQWRGAGVFDQIMAAVAASGAGDVAVQMIDSTVIWAQQNSVGLEKENLFECLGSIPWWVLSQDPRPV